MHILLKFKANKKAQGRDDLGAVRVFDDGHGGQPPGVRQPLQQGRVEEGV